MTKNHIIAGLLVLTAVTNIASVKIGYKDGYADADSKYTDLERRLTVELNVED